MVLDYKYIKPNNKIYHYEYFSTRLKNRYKPCFAGVRKIARLSNVTCERTRRYALDSVYAIAPRLCINSNKIPGAVPFIFVF